MALLLLLRDYISLAKKNRFCFNPYTYYHMHNVYKTFKHYTYK